MSFILIFFFIHFLPQVSCQQIVFIWGVCSQPFSCLFARAFDCGGEEIYTSTLQHSINTY